MHGCGIYSEMIPSGKSPIKDLLYPVSMGTFFKPMQFAHFAASENRLYTVGQFWHIEILTCFPGSGELNKINRIELDGWIIELFCFIP